jgi:hypothetical protein
VSIVPPKNSPTGVSKIIDFINQFVKLLRVDNFNMNLEFVIPYSIYPDVLFNPRSAVPLLSQQEDIRSGTAVYY